jgi:D-alanyl-lipoteichoic acid acyltransferase DltB (MBOAT superfamily)
MFLWLSIANNLGILGVFKYYNFFAQQFQHAFGVIGIHINPVFLDIVLPVGISFYTFHGMSYVFDIYRGVRKPVTNFVEYAVFVCFFPLLVAGPIERANHLLPQVQNKRLFKYSQALEGCKLMLWGMFKKVVIADSLAVTVDNVFGNQNSYGAFSLILGAIAFSFQIYGDFSGYSDMALGISKLFGFELLSNFKFPYFSRNVAEFWKRWHISLSSWFRDYLYIPLGGSKNGKLKTIRNTFIIFLVSGFWHGASWNYIIWGVIHALGFMPFLLLNKNRQYVSTVAAADRKLPNLKELRQMIFTFSYVTFAWIFFRIKSLQTAVAYCKKIVTDSFHSPSQFFQRPHEIYIIAYILPLLLIDWWLRRDERIIRTTKFKTINWLIAIIMTACIINKFFGYLDLKPTSFIYFEF